MDALSVSTRVARRYFRYHHAYEDLVSEGALAITAGTHRDSRPWFQWAYGRARAGMIDWLRREQRHTMLMVNANGLPVGERAAVHVIPPLSLDAELGDGDDFTLHDVTAAPEEPDPVQREHLEAAVERALRRLPPRAEQLVRLYHLAELPTSDIADLLGVKPESVHTMLMQAREKLRERNPSLRGWLPGDARPEPPPSFTTPAHVRRSRAARSALPSLPPAARR